MKFKNLKEFIKPYSRVLLMLFITVFCVTFTMNAQNSTVTGIILESGQVNTPIPGISILKKGTKTGATTDFDGTYSIEANIGDILEFRYLGMITQSIKVTQLTLNVKMEQDLEHLDEVVVIGYGSVKKKELTGAVTTIDAEDIANIVTSDLGSTLQGQVAGLNVVSGGSPGAPSEITIRGITTIAGSNTPLYVVNGIPQNDDPGLSPNEIETITVLKDASTTAIYGVRGAAGVILITTKQGEKGVLKVGLNASYGIQNIISPELPLMNAAEQTFFEIVRKRNTFGTNDDQAVLDLIRSPEGFLFDTSLADAVFIDNQVVQDYNLNISGGGDELMYNVTLGFYEKEGAIVNSGFKRFNMRANTTYKSGRWKIDTSVGFSSEELNAIPFGAVNRAFRYFPTQPDLDLSGDITGPINSPEGDGTNRLNWVLESLLSTDVTKTVKTFGNLNLKYNIANNLSLTSRLGADFRNSYRKRFQPYVEVFDATNDNKLLSDSNNSQVNNEATRSVNVSWDGFLTYSKEFNNHKITLIGGASLERYSYESFGAAKTEVNNEIPVINAATGTPIAYSAPIDRYFLSGDEEEVTTGMFLRTQYSYKGIHNLSGVVRRDGSSKFRNQPIGIFPSIGYAWNIAEENFWKGTKAVVNDFKLRAGYGEVGNQRIPSYAFASTISSGIDYSFGSGDGNLGSGFTQTGFANSLVGWEVSKQTNFGVDLALFKNRLTFTADYYEKNNEDMLFPVFIPNSSGGGTGSSVILNVGNMTNKGLELSLGFREKIGELNFNINATYTQNDNKITQITGEDSFLFTNDSGLVPDSKDVSQITTLTEGFEAGAFFIFETDGLVDSSEKLTAYSEIVPNAQLGDLIYKDQNGDNQISSLDRVYAGSGLSDYEVGLNFGTNYKNIDFSMQWYGAFGHEIMNGSKATAYGYGRHRDLVSAYSSANTNTTIPSYRGDLKSHPNFRSYTDLFLEDGSYVRLKQITLGYSFSDKITQKLGVSKFRVYATAQNPITITDYTGYDPEVGGGVSGRGLDKGIYPITAFYSVGLNLNF